MARQVAKAKPDAILFYCTNLPGAAPAPQWKPSSASPCSILSLRGVGALSALGLSSSPCCRGRLLV